MTTFTPLNEKSFENIAQNIFYPMKDEYNVLSNI